ncbi:MAG: hypothetical protein IPJ86_00085 [Bacteroidetes bacterium]|nr:hypothetical protein [Bacteroidota bacterium]
MDELEPVVDYFIKKMGELKEDQLMTQLKEKKLNEQIGKNTATTECASSEQQQPTGNIIVKVDARSRTMSSLISVMSLTPMSPGMHL